MNVFDFDKTIFNGDSTAKFYKYCIKKYPRVLRHLPSMVCAFVRYYIFKKGTKTQCKQIFYRFLHEIPDVDKAVSDFWDKNYDGIFDWYKKLHTADDIIISASPEFLLEGICKRLEVAKLMASRVDKSTGIYDGENCHGEEKVRRFCDYLPDGEIDEFYSDSISDLPLARIAKKAYVITKDGKVKDWGTVFPGTLNQSESV
ncbi:MAG: haloacid dehalogenase-like hydrolase [Clostridia bacterium]|nr:haloacid dehalogenase-like hydrolase [Clostridia bacterium]